MKTTEKYPTYVNVDQIADDQYLVNLLLNKNQLEELQNIANKSRSKLSGQYHAMVISIDNAIQEFKEKTR
jgi:pentose-5-phosphate-3-epimerase